MVTEAILTVLFAVGSFIIGILPEFVFNVFNGSAGLATMLAYALYFFPGDLWLFALGNILIMMQITIAYAVLEWVWKKIPGIN